jgi:hypothetical protein
VLTRSEVLVALAVAWALAAGHVAVHRLRAEALGFDTGAAVVCAAVLSAALWPIWRADYPPAAPDG